MGGCPGRHPGREPRGAMSIRAIPANVATRLTRRRQPAQAAPAAAQSAAGFSSSNTQGAQRPSSDAGAFFTTSSGWARALRHLPMAGGVGEPQGSPGPCVRSANPAPSAPMFSSVGADSITQGVHHE